MFQGLGVIGDLSVYFVSGLFFGAFFFGGKFIARNWNGSNFLGSIVYGIFLLLALVSAIFCLMALVVLFAKSFFLALAGAFLVLLIAFLTT